MYLTGACELFYSRSVLLQKIAVPCLDSITAKHYNSRMGTRLKFNPSALREARERAGMSATELSSISGVHRSTIYMIERGEQSKPSVEHVATLAYHLRKPLECLFFIENNCSDTENTIDKLQ